MKNVSPKIQISIFFAIGLFLISGIYVYLNRENTQTPELIKTKSDIPSNKDEKSKEDENKIDIISENSSDSTVKNKKDEDAYKTKTASIAEQVFGTYFTRKELDVYSPDDAKKIVDIATKRALTHTIPQFKEADIKVLNSNTQEDAINYKKSVKEALNPVFLIPEYELQTYARATDKNDPKEFVKLKSAANSYAESVELLLAIKAPEDAAMAHLSLINAFTKMSYALTEMSKGYDDVVGSFTALKVFAEGETDVDVAFKRHNTYFLVHNVSDL